MRTVHLRKQGWSTTLCGRETLTLEMFTSQKITQVNCKVCLRKDHVLGRCSIYAGEKIRDVEIAVWRGLEPWKKRSFVRSTSEKIVMEWFAYSRADRAVLLSELVKDRGYAFRLGLPGRPFDHSDVDVIERYARDVLERLRALQKDIKRAEKILPSIISKQELVIRQMVGEATKEVS